MFEYLNGFKYIFVSGMQRSGTTICMRMIQYDIEAPQCVWIGDSLDILFRYQEYFPAREFIFHSPAVSQHLHDIAKEKDTVVIWMKRDIEESLSSARTVRGVGIDFTGTLQNLGLESTGDYGEDFRLIAETKESRWKEQKKLIPNWYEIEYESLREHRLWIDKKVRVQYSWRHTRWTSPGLISKIKKVCQPTEGGELKHLLQEFPKEKSDWIPPWEK